MKQPFTLLCVAFTTLAMAQTVSIQGGASYPTIAAAILAANSGDVILITGVHTESLSIDKSITLRGINPANDIVQAAAAPGTGGTGARVINIGAAAAAALNVTVENLTIRHGNAAANGGGINVDKVTGLVTLRNLIITNNFTTSNGGGLGFGGSNVNVIGCSIQNNSSALDGGGFIAAPNNASSTNSTVLISRSLINANTGRNGGGIYINGNNTFGNNYTITVNVDNTTISNNAASSAASGNGGGAIFTACAFWTTTAGGDGTSGNITLRLVHATVFNNTHAAPLRAGLRFGGVTNALTNFSAYNSIIVANNEISIKALNFQNSNTSNVVNCIMGGLELAPTLVDDVAKNNLKGRTATQSGLSGVLSNQGGSTSVIDIAASSNADDYCTAAITGVTIPAVDQRDYTREGVNDAGAFEVGGVLSVENPSFTANSLLIYPNPASDVLYIKSPSVISNVSIYDLTGRTVYQSNSFDQSINISSLASGMHLLKVKSEGQTVTKAFLVK